MIDMLIDFQNGCTKAVEKFKSCVLFDRFDSLYDVKQWMTDFMEPIHNHSNPHIFQFKKDSDKKVRMYYKKWDSDSWMPTKGIQLMKVCACPSLTLISFIINCSPYRMEFLNLFLKAPRNSALRS